MAKSHWTSVLLITGIGVWAFPPLAESQDALGACQDQLRGVRVYAERLAKSKQADDLDAAQVIANLIKQIESLQAEMQRIKAKPPESPTVPKVAPQGGETH